MSVHLQVNMTHLEWSTFSPTRTSSSQLYSPISKQKSLSFHVHVNVTALSLTEYIKNSLSFWGVAHLSLCIITYCSISTVNVLVRLASFFFYVFFSSSGFASSSYSLQPPSDFLNPPTKSFLFSSFSGEHQQTVLGLSTGHQLRNLRLHHRLTVWLLWETICRIPPPGMAVTFWAVCWWQRSGLSAGGNEKSGKAVEIFGSSIHIIPF